jgi:GNAT superfamily N-acetyltransferase
MPAQPRRRASGHAIEPLTPARWPDLVKLFGPRGACAGCWCMWWRLARPQWTAGKGDGNRRALERYVEAGHVPGLLAYEGGEPVGWVAVEPREAYPRLSRSRTLAAVDERPVWSLTCFFVARSHRRRGLTRALVRAALRHARSRGARIVEAYPVDRRERVADAWVYTGAASTFRALGFREVARRSATRPIVRKALGAARSPSRPAAPRRRGQRASARST